MSSFFFHGAIPASKSILNRLLVLQSFEPALVVNIDSKADDVMSMRSALTSLLAGRAAECGAAGTTLRFLALRAARIPGRHLLTGSARLLERPHDEINRILTQLGGEARILKSGIEIKSDGWKIPDAGLRVEQSVSSQFTSAVLLSSWGLAKPLKIFLEGEAVSAGYLQMTLALLHQAGMQIKQTGDGLVVSEGASIRLGRIEPEMDISSAFAVAALAAASGGEAKFEAWPLKSLQPDAVFPELLEQMGCRIHFNQQARTLTVNGPSRPHRLKPIRADLRNSPDLFPVLSALCALADGESQLSGAPHLAHKESSRIAKSAELIGLMGADVEVLPDGLRIIGSQTVPSSVHHPEKTTDQTTGQAFDPDHDHRLAMAAAVARAAGYPIRILRTEVVNKSFPEFWKIVREGFGVASQ